MDKQPRIDTRSIEKKTRWAWALGTFFGAGLLGPGPGTYGSAAAVILWFITIHLTRASYHAQIIGTLVAALIVTRIGIPAATVVARESGREDPGHVVIDEVAGQLFALIAIPADWPHALVGLLLFRIFDILKPPPVRQLERLPAGTGIMLDDVAAGLMALAVGHLILHFF
jgi:phosphatidylglycerophosphatase A